MNWACEEDQDDHDVGTHRSVKLYAPYASMRFRDSWSDDVSDKKANECW